MKLTSIAPSFVSAVAAVSAAPSLLGLTSRQIPNHYNPGCDGTPAGSIAFANGFTITALNTSLPNANDTGVPLVVGAIAGGDGAELYSLSTYATYPYNQWPQFELFEGRLFAFGPDVHDAVAIAPSAGGELVLIAPPQGPSDQAFCALPRGGGFNLLAANGDAANWSLCPDTNPGTQVRVYYKPAADIEGCYPVDLLISDDSLA